jgi:hypothetical protein
MAAEPDTMKPGRWSPFAPLERHCAAVADALLKACEHEDCAIVDMSAARYDDVRSRNPQLGLPRTTTITGACGGWDEAVGHALVKAAMDLRERRAA